MRVTYWKCPKCYGTGRQIVGNSAIECSACAGSGNSFTNGDEVYHRRRLEEIDAANAEFQKTLKP